MPILIKISHYKSLFNCHKSSKNRMASNSITTNPAKPINLNLYSHQFVEVSGHEGKKKVESSTRTCQQWLKQEDWEEEEKDEEEELFEIDLELVEKNLSQPNNYWESYFTTTNDNNIALLANCLLPISHLSSAVPIAPDSFLPSFSRNRGVFILTNVAPTPKIKDFRDVADYHVTS